MRQWGVVLGCFLASVACSTEKVVYVPGNIASGLVATSDPLPSALPLANSVKTVTLTGVITADGFQLAAAGGAGVANAKVQLENTSFETKTDAQGHFELKDVPADKVQNLVAKKSDNQGKQYQVRQPLAPPTSATVDLKSLTMTRTGSIYGLVKVAGDLDLVGMDVFIKGTTMVSKTDTDGSYLIPNVPEGDYTLVARKAGYRPATVTVKVVTGKPSQALLNVTDKETSNMGSLEGTVSSSSGPLAGAIVSIPGETYTAVTDKNGKYRLANVIPKNDYPLLVMRDGYETQEATVTVKAGETLKKDIALSAKSDEHPGNIKGTLKDKDGQPVANADVETEPATTPTKTDAQGNFNIPNALPGSYAVKGVKDSQTKANHVFGLDSGQSIQFAVQGLLIDNSVNINNVNCGTTTNTNTITVNNGSPSTNPASFRIQSTNQINCGSTNVLSPTIVIGGR